MASNNIYTIERDGSLYRTNPSTGVWVGIGKKGEWANTIAGTATDNYLYTVEKSGALYETNTNTGT